jgi:hypothetical protein
MHIQITVKKTTCWEEKEMKRKTDKKNATAQIKD